MSKTYKRPSIPQHRELAEGRYKSKVVNLKKKKAVKYLKKDIEDYLEGYDYRPGGELVTEE